MLKSKLNQMSDNDIIGLQQELYNSTGSYSEDSNVRKLINECFPDESLFMLRVTDIIVALLPEMTNRFVDCINLLNNEKLNHEELL